MIFFQSWNIFSWVEKWLRRWRGVYCGHQTQTDINSFAILTGICQETIRDLRSAKCASGSQEGKSVLTSLKYDLECDVFNHSTSIQSSTFWLLMATCVALCVQTVGWWWLRWWQKWSRLLFLVLLTVRDSQKTLPFPTKNEPNFMLNEFPCVIQKNMNVIKTCTWRLTCQKTD